MPNNRSFSRGWDLRTGPDGPGPGPAGQGWALLAGSVEWNGTENCPPLSKGVWGVLCNIPEFYLVRFPNGVVKKRTCFSFHLLRGNGLRIEWTMYYVFSIFGSLGDWNVPGTWI